ncbi:winged helix-turn-helix transcriptional regulator [Chryseobacterium sp. Mn2064]|uniref:winged helix-turn-helix transcriptional regulator n=1 Tax=Chryseobacterium sp. Mn2064 TaxID=3395263 RepID=UPI003BE1DE0B
MNLYNKRLPEYPLRKATGVLGNKWKPIIIVTIGKKTLRFGEIAEAIHLISRKVLTDQLRELENDDVLVRKEFKELPPRVEYSLTEKGISLLPILFLFEEWEHQYCGEETIPESTTPLLIL